MWLFLRDVGMESSRVVLCPRLIVVADPSPLWRLEKPFSGAQTTQQAWSLLGMSMHGVNKSRSAAGILNTAWVGGEAKAEVLSGSDSARVPD